MYLSEIEEAIKSIKTESDSVLKLRLVLDFYSKVFKNISTGQCQDAPPEDFALEVDKSNLHEGLVDSVLKEFDEMMHEGYSEAYDMIVRLRENLPQQTDHEF